MLQGSSVNTLQIRNSVTLILSTVESGMFACIYLDDYDDEIDFGKRLFDFCNENGYIICGDYICEELTEFNVFDGSRRWA